MTLATILFVPFSYMVMTLRGCKRTGDTPPPPLGTGVLHTPEFVT